MVFNAKEVISLCRNIRKKGEKKKKKKKKETCKQYYLHNKEILQEMLVLNTKTYLKKNRIKKREKPKKTITKYV